MDGIMKSSINVEKMKHLCYNTCIPLEQVFE